MKKLTLLLTLVVATLALKAQPQTTVFEVNNLSALIHANGLLFDNGGQGQLISGDFPGASLISRAGLIIGGLDPGFNLKGASHLLPAGAAGNFEALSVGDITFDRFWQVSAEQISAHRADWSDNHIIDNPIDAIFAWPGRGNPYAEEQNGFALPTGSSGYAPFWDKDGDAIYNPAQGDFPVLSIRGCNGPVIPDEMLWFAFQTRAHEGTPAGVTPIELEIQALVFGFDCAESQTLSNSLFVNYKIINRSSESADSLYFGQLNEFTLGCPNDDYLGVFPDLNSVYVYNSDNNDENCGGISGLGENPPVLALTHFRGPLTENLEELSLTHAMPVYPVGGAYPAATALPGTFVESYRYLSGHWRDGLPLSYGGLGYQTGIPVNLAFPGDPFEPTQWSEWTAGNTPGQRSVIASAGPIRLLPGAVNEMILGYTLFNKDGEDHLDQISAARDSLAQLRLFFDNCFDAELTGWHSACGALATGLKEISSGPAFSISPNPASSLALCKWPEGLTPQIVWISNTLGQQIGVLTPVAGDQLTELDLGLLPAGTYSVTAIFGQARSTQRLVVVK